MTHPMYTSTIPYYHNAPAPPPPTPELTEAMINEALALWKSGVPLQRRSTNNEWIDIPRPSLSVLMAWMAQFKYLSIRAAPPKPREYWVAEYKLSGINKLTGMYTSQAACERAWSNSIYFVRVVKFVEVIE